MRLVRFHFVVFCLLLAQLPAAAAFIVPSDGSDGPFSPTQNVQIDLSQAATGTWDQASPQPGKGIYDPDKWAVVFKYASVNIPAGVTVTFKNHPSYAPVVWLVQGDVTIAGTVSLDGQTTLTVTAGPPFAAEPGPGGFHSGSVRLAPGGSSTDGGYPRGPGAKGYGDYAVYSQSLSHYRAYGNESIVPLIGGSGGGSHANTDTGGGGGGAILIASAGTIDVSGTIRARGGGKAQTTYAGCGSGGGVRLVAPIVRGQGSILADSDWSFTEGRIRVEANDYSFSLTCDPAASIAPAGSSAYVWPKAHAPRIRAVTLGSQTVPSDPRPSFALGRADMIFSSVGTRTIVIQAENVPLDWFVRVRAVRGSGYPVSGYATFVSGDLANSTWEFDLNMETEGFYFILVDGFKDPIPS